MNLSSKIGISLSASALCVVSVLANTAKVNGITWTYTVSNGQASLGDGTRSSFSGGAIPKSTSGSITIPSSLGGSPVTSIGSDAFYNCDGLTSVTIGNSVTSIGENAFESCDGLTSVTIGNSVTSIGKNAFRYCKGLTSVTIGNSVTSIGKDAFDTCTNLTSVCIMDLTAWCNINFPRGYSTSNPLYYAHRLYLNGEELVELAIPSSIDSVKSAAFMGCSVTNVIIPSSVKSIESYAFSYCSELTRITIPDGVTNVAVSAFSNCEKLEDVTIPNSVTALNSFAFEGCSKLWAVWYKKLANTFGDGGSGSGSLSGGATIIQQVESPYALTDTMADRAIASFVVSSDSAIDSFVLKDGKVYDAMLYISNTADREVTLSLPSGYLYKTIKGARPLTIPASSQCIISITRVDAGCFLVMREELEDVK